MKLSLPARVRTLLRDGPRSEPGGPRPRIPLDPRTWRSPLRGPWLTSVFGLVLLIGLPVVIITGLLSYVAYGPQFGQAFPKHVGFLHLPYFLQPTRPVWLYRLTQGLHVGLGLALIPVVLAKLWSVIPKLFAFPPVKSLAQLLERLSLIGLVGGIIFELVTGVLNIQYDYVFKFDFYTAHYYGAWVFIASFVVHVGIKFPTMARNVRTRRLVDELRIPVAETRPEPFDPETGLVAVEPAEPTMSRRGLLGMVSGAAVLVTVVTAGETVPHARWLAYLSVRGRSYGNGPTDFQVNRTAFIAGIRTADTGAAWRLTLRSGAGTVASLTRAQLLGMPQHTARLPISCVEGWSSEQTWTGVRLRDLAARAGSAAAATMVALSLERHGTFNRVEFGHAQFSDADALLALRVNGVDLSMDHGYPARIIVPGLPGVHQTKWVRELSFGAA